VQVSIVSNVTTLAAGLWHSLALKEDGTVWAWNKYCYAVINGMMRPRKTVQVANLSNVKKLAAGNSHSLALKEDGTVWIWYKWNISLLRYGTNDTIFLPEQVFNLSNVKTLAAGKSHSLALKEDGTVWAWGYNNLGQLGHNYPTYLPEKCISELQFSSKNYVADKNSIIHIPVMNNTTSKDVSICYSTKNGSALSGIDYIEKSGTLTFSENDKVRTISVTILNNNLATEDKTLYILLSASNDIFLNDGALSTITISANDSVQAPYSQTFSSIMPASGWKFYSSEQTGRIDVKSDSLIMDNLDNEVSNLNEAILCIDILYFKNVHIHFFQRNIDSINISLPESYTNHYNGNGISISNDNQAWYRVMDAQDLATGYYGKDFSIDLDSKITDIQNNFDPSFELTKNMQIKFQQYGRRTYPSGGREWDNISVSGVSNYSIPIAHDTILHVTEDIAKNSTLSAIQENGLPLQYTIVTYPAKGNVTITNYSTGAYTYQPDMNETGEDYFTFKVADPKSESNTARVQVVINPVNDVPVATGSAENTEEDKYINLQLKATDVDQDQLTYIIIKQPIHGKVETNGDLALYTPSKDYNGVDRFSFKVNDGISDSNVADIVLTIYPVPDPPIAHSKTVYTSENSSLPFELFASDDDGDALSYSITQMPQYGTLSGTGPDIIYEPDPWYWGTDTFLFTANDGIFTSEPAQMTIAIARAEKYTMTLFSNHANQIKVQQTNVLPTWKGPFNADEQVRLEAIPNTDWMFVQWFGDVESSQNPVYITMDTVKTIRASFAIQTFDLTIQGNEIILINNIEHTLPLSKTFEIHSNISLQSNSKYFRCWEGDIQICDRLIEFRINSNMNLTPINYPIPIWQTTITAKRQVEDADVQYTSTINIGTATQAYSKPPKDLPEKYSCDIKLYDSNLEFVKEVIQQETNNKHIWNLAVDPRGNIGNPVFETSASISWNPQSFSSKGNYELKKGFDGIGETVISDMRNTTTYLVTHNSYKGFSIIWQKNETFTYHLEQGWNLISLPIIPEQTNVKDIFPDSIAAFEFNDGSYVSISKIEPGKGYWIKVPSKADYEIVGQLYSNYTKSLSKGWHLIGGTDSATIPSTEPENSILVIYRYVNGSYEIVSELEPGYGYWVKMNQDCLMGSGQDNPLK
jgi:hypothetical protein